MITMHKRILLAVGAILVLLLAFFIVHKDNNKIKTELQKDVTQQEVIVLDPVTKKIQEKNDLYSIEIEYPEFGNDVIDTAIDNYITTAQKDFKDMFINDEYFAELQTTSSLYINYTLKKNQDTTSIIFTGYQDTGGAHPNPFVYTIITNSQGIRSLDSLFSVPQLEYLTRIQTIAELSLKNQLQDSFFKEGLEPRIENYQNWYVIDNAITFIFSPYQVGPYAVGMPEVTIPYSQIQDILK
jgi:hypothetical protein